MLFTSVLLAGIAFACSASAQPAAFHKQRVTFANGSLTLVGYLYRPDGPGPFPTLIWNHGSEQDPGSAPQFDAVAAIFVPAGYVVFAHVRRGQGESQGTYIQDAIHDAGQNWARTPPSGSWCDSCRPSS